jgi:hypothetical protein
MTVWELINELTKLDPDAKVYHQSTGGIIDEVVVVKVIEPHDRDAKFMEPGSAYLP